MTDHLVPRVGRPILPPDYGLPTTLEGILPWSHARQRLEAALTYWVGTVDPAGRPHATPIWGVWLEEGLYFDGSPQTRRGRNIAQNPAVVVHLESGTDVIILHGDAMEIHGPAPELAARLVAAYSTKYVALGYSPSLDTWKSGGLYHVRTRLVMAWTQFPKDATRWKF